MRPRFGITYSDEIRVGPYSDAIFASGGEPVAISPEDTVDSKSLDGLLLGGGVDVDPELYGEPLALETEAPNQNRDRMEQALLKQFLDRDLPVLGICRGLQMLNVTQGGSLQQHITGHEVRRGSKSLPAHPVQLESDSHVRRIYGFDTLEVNSRHHQAIARVSEKLRVTATAPDGIIEALESPLHRFVVSVQWHPEDMAAVDAIQKKLFDAFVRAADR